jgi:hypothetical protein
VKVKIKDGHTAAQAPSPLQEEVEWTADISARNLFKYTFYKSVVPTEEVAVGILWPIKALIFFIVDFILRNVITSDASQLMKYVAIPVY